MLIIRNLNLISGQSWTYLHNYTKNMWAHWYFGQTEILQFLKIDISFDTSPKELNISTITSLSSAWSQFPSSLMPSLRKIVWY